MVFLTLLFLGTVLSTHVLVEACSCMPPNPSEMYCSSAFVLKVEILNETSLGGSDMGFSSQYWYDINVVEEYRFGLLVWLPCNTFNLNYTNTFFRYIPESKNKI